MIKYFSKSDTFAPTPGEGNAELGVDSFCLTIVSVRRLRDKRTLGSVPFWGDCGWVQRPNMGFINLLLPRLLESGFE